MSPFSYLSNINNKQAEESSLLKYLIAQKTGNLSDMYINTETQKNRQKLKKN